MTTDLKELFSNMPAEKITAWNAAQLDDFLDWQYKKLQRPRPVLPAYPAPAPQPAKSKPVKKARVIVSRKPWNSKPQTRAAEAFIREQKETDQPRPTTNQVVTQFGVNDSWVRTKLRQYYGLAPTYKGGPKCEASKQQRIKASEFIAGCDSRPTVAEIATRFKISRIYAGELIREKFASE